MGVVGSAGRGELTGATCGSTSLGDTGVSFDSLNVCLVGELFVLLNIPPVDAVGEVICGSIVFTGSVGDDVGCFSCSRAKRSASRNNSFCFLF